MPQIEIFIKVNILTPMVRKSSSSQGEVNQQVLDLSDLQIEIEEAKQLGNRTSPSKSLKDSQAKM